MAFTDRNFGVEIEAVGIDFDRGEEILSKYNYFDWSSVEEGSVPHGFELVSPILSGETGLKEVRNVADVFADYGCYADMNCGLHVHVNIEDFTALEIFNLLSRFSLYEEVLFSLVPSHRKDNENCNIMFNKWFDRNKERLCEEVLERPEKFYTEFNEKFMSMNLAAYRSKGTVEFRFHSGSVNSEKINNWVKFCVNFVDNSRLSQEDYDNIEKFKYQHNSDEGEEPLNGVDIFKLFNLNRDSLSLKSRTILLLCQGKYNRKQLSENLNIPYHKTTKLIETLKKEDVNIINRKEKTSDSNRKVEHFFIPERHIREELLNLKLLRNFTFPEKPEEPFPYRKLGVNEYRRRMSEYSKNLFEYYQLLKIFGYDRSKYMSKKESNIVSLRISSLKHAENHTKDFSSKNYRKVLELFEEKAKKSNPLNDLDGKTKSFFIEREFDMKTL